MKTCNICKKAKEATPANFQRSARHSDGFRNPCKLCLSTKRGKDHIVDINKMMPVKVKIEEPDDIFTQLEKKYGVHYVIAGNGKGMARLQIHCGNPDLHFSGKPSEILSLALGT